MYTLLRQTRSTIDQLFNIRETLRRTWEVDIDVHQISVNFRQSYDAINRNKLYYSMNELGVPGKLIRLVKATMNGQYRTELAQLTD